MKKTVLALVVLAVVGALAFILTSTGDGSTAGESGPPARGGRAHSGGHAAAMDGAQVVAQMADPPTSLLGREKSAPQDGGTIGLDFAAGAGG